LGIADQPWQPPCALQEFWPLQAFLSVLQPPMPLQEFWPLHECFASVLDGAEALAGVWGWGSFAQPTAPSEIPVTAAAIRLFVIFIVFLSGVDGW
jgi:hypothetical protein